MRLTRDKKVLGGRGDRLRIHQKKTMTTCIKDLNKIELLYYLWENAPRPHKSLTLPFDIQGAEKVCKTWIDHFCGKPIKANLAKNYVDFTEYNKNKKKRGEDIVSELYQIYKWKEERKKYQNETKIVSKDEKMKFTPMILKEFTKLSQIPRHSNDTKGMHHYLVEWSTKELPGSSYEIDEIGNLVIHVSSRPGKPSLILQSHFDMVCVARLNSKHDFSKDPIVIQIDGNRMFAKDTTLGADNGISLVTSLILAKLLLSENKLRDLNLHLLFTSKEEQGLQGAEHLQLKLPEHANLLNLDSESSHNICVGSVGSSKTEITFPVAQETKRKTFLHEIEVRFCQGGHSGVEIHKGRANAILLCAQLLINQDAIICEIEGGEAENSIPTFCRVAFQTNTPLDSFVHLIEEKHKMWKVSFNENTLEIRIRTLAFPEEPMTTFPTLLDGLLLLHQGILSHNPYIENEMLASTNVGLINKFGLVTILSRSLTKEGVFLYYQRLQVIAKNMKATISPFHFHPGWSPVPNSPLLEALQTCHKKLFKEKANCFTVHAGLETSILLAKYPKWDIQSIGPTIEKAHTTEETLFIDTIEPFAVWLQELILYLQS